MICLIAGLILFLGVHSLAIVGLRPRLINQWGLSLYRALHALVSLAGLVLIARGYADTRLAPVVLFDAPHALRLLVVALLAPVFPFVLASALDCRLRTTLKHPLLVAIKLWALAHLLANGTLAGTLLFTSFLAWAVLTRISLKRRTGSVRVTVLGVGKFGDAVAVLGGLTLYYAFLTGWHHALIGVTPLP
jgi:uncharacterized membrane protein